MFALNKKINVLLFGSGAREHALAWKIKQSSMLEKLFLASPNDGFSDLGEVIEFDNFDDLAKKASQRNIELLVVGPEIPLSEGIVDVFEKHGIKSIGANKKWAKLEGSKSFAKEFMQKHGIPTAKYELIDDKNQIDTVLAKFSSPPVLKADGLAAGKGVYIPKSIEDAKSTLGDFLSGKFGKASSSVVVEEFLEGEELSVISIYDGQNLATFVGARDYKRLLDDNKGPNTGGMGSYCPVSITKNQENELAAYLKTLERALVKERADFCGIIYSGLMLTKSGLKVLEYNMRFGDPETQALMMHLESDILKLFINAINKNLNNISLKWKSGSSLCIVIAADGYPDCPKTECEIKNLEEISKKYDVQIFTAGVKKSNTKLLSNGGRVLSVCKAGTGIREDVYKACREIDFDDKIFRTDIGENL